MVTNSDFLNYKKRKLTIDSKPLLQHNLDQVETNMDYLVYCQTTFKEVILVLSQDIFPDKVDWKYPEQFLSTMQLCHVFDKLDNVDIEVNVLSTTPIISTRCRMHKVTEIINGKEYSVKNHRYRRINDGDIFDHMQ